ncbi:MAG TPA: P1 family peptidase [Candidatus Acidoferrales bacterium]|nr:P1 family peptidase [Candidatus Acidoferrales bacterium]
MDRREFNRSLAAAVGGALLSPAAATGFAEPDSAAEEAGVGGLTDVEGLKVGHFTDKRRPTGCTVILCEKGATGGVDVRGGAPGTRETDLLRPVNTVQQVFGLVLSGGSAFGLDAASGVMRYLDERGIGYKVGPTMTVPIVPAAILFDLGVGGDWKIRPTAESGYQACLAASAGRIEEGNVGAGAGATVGKMFGPQFAMKSGLGTASIRAGSTGVVVAAMVAVNAVGDIYNPRTGRIVAGARTADGKGFRSAIARMREGYAVEMPTGTNTTIGVVATNARLNKDQATKVAQMAHDGYGRAINPTHTPADGDTIFALATGTSAARVNHGAIGALAAEVMAMAIVRAATQAAGIPGYPSYRDLKE